MMTVPTTTDMGEHHQNRIHYRQHGQQHSMNKSGGKGSTDNSNCNNERSHHRGQSYVPRVDKKQVRLCAEKRIRDLEDDVQELEAENTHSGWS